MSLFLRIISILALLVFLLSGAVAANLYWNFNFGDCKDGCAEGMAYIYFLPAVVIALFSAIVAIISHRISKRTRS